MINLKVNGRKVSPNQIANDLDQEEFKLVRDKLVRKLRGIRDPETGASPKFKVTGQNLRNLKIEIDGSPKLIKKVQSLLDQELS